MKEPKLPRTIRIATLVAVFMVALLSLGGIRLVSWAFASTEVLVIKNTPVPAKPPEVKDGDRVYLTIDFCKNSNAVGRNTVHLIGSQGAKVSIDWPEDTTKKQCAIFAEIPVPIPAQTPSDTYHVEFITCYDINPLKKNKCSTFTSQSFKVINSKLNPGDAKVQ